MIVFQARRQLDLGNSLVSANVMFMIPQASFSYSKKAILSDIGSLARFSLASPLTLSRPFEWGVMVYSCSSRKADTRTGPRREEGSMREWHPILRELEWGQILPSSKRLRRSLDSSLYCMYTLQCFQLQIKILDELSEQYFVHLPACFLFCGLSRPQILIWR